MGGVGESYTKQTTIEVRKPKKKPSSIPLSRRRCRLSSPTAAALWSSASRSLSVVDDEDDDNIVDMLAAATACRSPAKKSVATTAGGFRDMEVSNTGDRKAWRRPLAPSCFGRKIRQRADFLRRLVCGFQRLVSLLWPLPAPQTKPPKHEGIRDR